MDRRKSLHPKSRLASFRYAFSGLRSLLRQEPNIKLHALFTVLALGMGWYKQLSRLEWIALVVVIALVWVTEALNTCIEELCNLYVGEEFHPKVKLIKDIAAGAVLVASIAALITGGILFLK
jgi:diacylglycerol kinase (ATP)